MNNNFIGSHPVIKLYHGNFITISYLAWMVYGSLKCHNLVCKLTHSDKPITKFKTAFLVSHFLMLSCCVFVLWGSSFMIMWRCCIVCYVFVEFNATGLLEVATFYTFCCTNRLNYLWWCSVWGLLSISVLALPSTMISWIHNIPFIHVMGNLAFWWHTIIPAKLVDSGKIIKTSLANRQVDSWMQCWRWAYLLDWFSIL